MIKFLNFFSLPQDTVPPIYRDVEGSLTPAFAVTISYQDPRVAIISFIAAIPITMFAHILTNHLLEKKVGDNSRKFTLICVDSIAFNASIYALSGVVPSVSLIGLSILLGLVLTLKTFSRTSLPPTPNTSPTPNTPLYESS